MKLKSILFSLSIALVLFSKSVMAEESVLVCKGESKSSLFGDSSHDMSITLTKENGKLVKAVSSYGTAFTLKKTAMKKDKSTILHQLIVETDKMILRTEFPEDNEIFDTTVKNTGEYVHDSMIGYTSGRCERSNKLF